MGLFQKRTQIGNSQPFYKFGNQKTLLIVGLGNTGKKYDGTRHNIGFTCIDSLAEKLEFPDWTEKKNLKCLISEQNISDTKIVIIKPTTLMNLSGEAVQSVKKFYKVPDNQIIAVYDELDIPFGQIRTRVGGSSAGHNGVESLIAHINEGFGRVRIGIHNELSEKADGKDFVLGKFTKEELAKLPELLRETNSILSELIYGQTLTVETRSFLV
ncbi:MAG TPA: aminoacyl-tRNA hydrolase [Candidatus Saccharimonadales bacterium]|nr:aminoacyl-tRNA hydrolase [Candidatus Saccharimonadales bacterium]